MAGGAAIGPAIVDLRERPHHAATAADRVWRAFWQGDGYPLEHVRALVDANLGKGPIPTGFIALDGDRFLGTVALIACDQPKRPQYTPWLAGLWVEEAARERGVGTALVTAVRELAGALQVGRLYLGASSRRRPFYEKRGFALVEEDVPERGSHILATAL